MLSPLTNFSDHHSWAWLQNDQPALASVLPGVEHKILPGRTHVVKGKVLAPMLAEWLRSVGASSVTTEDSPHKGRHVTASPQYGTGNITAVHRVSLWAV